MPRLSRSATKGDSERELTDKGLKQAKAVGKGIESLGLVPDQISCSSVTRTRQTLDRMLKTFGDQANRRLPHQPV